MEGQHPGEAAGADGDRKGVRPARRLITCRRCQRVKPHSARGLCTACERYSRLDGTIRDYPRSTVAAEEIVEEMRSPAMLGKSYVDIAMFLGVSYRSAMTSYHRARRRGLVE